MIKKLFCVYKHIRLDNNQVFYIGIGNEKRPFTKKGRNNYWKNIVNKHGYSVEVLFSNLELNEAFSIEKYLIAYYGRTCNKSGILANLTEGGEGSLGFKHSDETISKISGVNNHMYNKEVSIETRSKISNSLLGNTNSVFGENNGKSRKVLDTKTGNIYTSIKSASDTFNINYNTLKNMLSGEKKNTTTLIKCP